MSTNSLTIGASKYSWKERSVSFWSLLLVIIEILTEYGFETLIIPSLAWCSVIMTEPESPLVSLTESLLMPRR